MYLSGYLSPSRPTACSRLLEFDMNPVTERSAMPEKLPPGRTREYYTGFRKKGLAIQAWALVDARGRVEMMEVGKSAIMRLTGLVSRDLRILDPVLAYPPRILGRERAIVVNLEHIKAIITAQEVLLLNSKDPAVASLLTDLQRRLSEKQVSRGAEATVTTGLNDRSKSMRRNRSANASADAPLISLKLASNALENKTCPKVLPFEFRALEICLEAACSCLDIEASMLEQEAYPALDELSFYVSTLNLERVRQIKSRLVAISRRVEKVRDELEQLLDDDGDMAEMYLTDKLSVQYLQEPFPISVDGVCAESTSCLENESKRVESVAEKGIANQTSTSSSDSDSAVKCLNVEELEMLLEAYFVHIDGILNKLLTLQEYVDDTEDYINMMLDDKQNNLLQMEVMMMTITLVINSFIVVVALFGMNIHIEVFRTGTFREFLWTICGSGIAVIAIYAIIIAWYKRKHLMQ